MVDSNRIKYADGLDRITTGLWSVDADEGQVYGHRGQSIGYVNTNGYIHIAMAEGNKKVTRLLAHRLIWQHVHGLVDDTLVINHIDGVKTNNRISNLELVSVVENNRHARRMGLITSPQGESHHRSVLVEHQIMAMRDARSHGRIYKDIARDFGVSTQQAWKIVNGQSWKHVATTHGVAVAPAHAVGDCMNLA